MKKWTLTTLTAVGLLMSAASVQAANLKIAVVDVKKCAEDSMFGQQQQESFKSLDAQLAKALGEKEKELRDLDEKLKDPSHLDSISKEEERKQKEELEQKSQRFAQMLQYRQQALQQAQYKFFQGLGDNVNKSAVKIAKQDKYDMVINAEAVFYFNDSFNATEAVIADMNDQFKKENQHATSEAESVEKDVSAEG